VGRDHIVQIGRLSGIKKFASNVSVIGVCIVY